MQVRLRWCLAGCAFGSQVVAFVLALLAGLNRFIIREEKLFEIILIAKLLIAIATPIKMHSAKGLRNKRL
jgi:hypothetical protein